MPRISKVNDNSIDIGGTSYAGIVTANYSLLVERFGQPSDSFDNYKSDAEWQIEFEDGSVATIYNWKDGKNYLGPDGLPIEDITEWHIGGRAKCVGWIEDYLHNAWPVFDEVRQKAQF